jgi:hypothetical protein
VVFAAATPATVKGPPDPVAERWISKPVSLLELSCQASRIVVGAVAVAVNTEELSAAALMINGASSAAGAAAGSLPQPPAAAPAARIVRSRWILDVMD